MDRAVADVMYAAACGLDVHRELRDWLLAAGCEAVGMEATGVYWLPVYSVLEGHVQMVVGNPNHVQNLWGHRTDRKDAKWISVRRTARVAEYESR